VSGDTLIGVGRLAEICMRLSARDESVVDAVLDLAVAMGWGDVFGLLDVRRGVAFH